MAFKRALITGVTGQDGAYLSKLLLDKNYEVCGFARRLSTPNFWRLQHLEVLDKIKIATGDMIDMASLNIAIQTFEPDEIYNLAAQSFVGSSFDQPSNAININGMGSLNILECVRSSKKPIKIYQASTSEMFGSSVSENGNQNENTPLKPNSPYASSKLLAHENARIYREAYDMFVCNGILFNHESELRGLEFVTRKITNAAARIKLGLQNKVELGNVDTQRDWGYAPEYVESMWKMMQQELPDDYVIATGETHTVKDFAKKAFSHVGLNWEDYVKVGEQFKRPYELPYLKGDPTKAKEKINWKPKIKFNELVKKMVDADFNRWKRNQNGESFPWDAITFPENINYLIKKKG